MRIFNPYDASSLENIIITFNNDNNKIQNLVIELGLNQLNKDNNEIYGQTRLTIKPGIKMIMMMVNNLLICSILFNYWKI